MESSRRHQRNSHDRERIYGADRRGEKQMKKTVKWPHETLPIGEIIPYENNPRTHSEKQIAMLAKLMKEYGIDQPIVVDEKGVILKGHDRRLAAIEAGFKKFPVVRHVGLSENDKRAIRIADNQVALLSGWDDELLKLEIKELQDQGFDLPMLG